MFSFFQFFVIKTLDPDWIRIRIHLNCWIQTVSGFNESGFTTLLKNINYLMLY
jgi:hypothetical protein